MKHFLRLPSSSKEVTISLSYVKDTYNWYRSQPQRRGFYLSFMPVEREFKGGLVTTRSSPQDGGNYRILLKEAKTLNRKTEATLEQFVADNLKTLYDLYVADDRAQLAHFVTSGELLPQALPQAA